MGVKGWFRAPRSRWARWTLAAVAALLVIGVVAAIASSSRLPGAGSAGAPPMTRQSAAAAAASSDAGAGPSGQPSAGDTPTAPLSATGAPSPLVAAAQPSCAATDQDRYVYHPDRLRVIATCLRATGTVEAIRSEADGDLHILLALDPPYASLLTAANQGPELGDLVVEPVCVRGVTQADAIAPCAADPDPLTSLPSVGMHVWMEGRYVLDTQHGGWAEFHPLYRWGAFGSSPAPSALGTPAAQPPPSGTALSVQIVTVSSPVSRGSMASLRAATAAGVTCQIRVTYKSGPSSAAGLGPATADASGALGWTWTVGTKTTPGTWPISVSCARGSESATAQTSFVVE